MIKPVILWSDGLFFLFLACVIAWVISIRHSEHWRLAWRHLTARPMAMVSLVIILAYLAVGLLDSVHFTVTGNNANTHYTQGIQSGLDWLLGPMGERDERSFSAPLALHSFQPVYKQQHGITQQVYPRLTHVAAHIQPGTPHIIDIGLRVLGGIVIGLGMTAIILCLVSALLARRHEHHWSGVFSQIISGRTAAAWRSILITLAIIAVCCSWAWLLGQHYYLLGTGKVGQSVFYQAVRSIRTGLLIGTLTTLVMLPLALLLGVAAGFFGGRADDFIQFLYITLSSIPAVLLISASVLAFQVIMANHPQWAPTGVERADLRLIGLCVILGITSWSSLCRLLRGETLKVRELDYLEAARALGANSWRMMRRHIVPNILHIILITVVLDFSMLVLAEVVLTYIGVGVHPNMMSWGQMINKARLELAREPVVWWPLTSAFIFMFVFVLSINLFADTLRDALDPRNRQ